MDLERATLVDRFRVVRVPETGSTNADLVTAARAGEASGLVLVADHQTVGRGRLGRSWTAPAGASLLLSVLIRTKAGASLHGATQAVGLAARAACLKVAGVRAEVKWPNDLLVGDRKLAGVLAEAVAGPRGVEAVVVGLGLNVRWGTGVPLELADRLVALDHLGADDVTTDDLIVPLLEELGRRLDQWEQQPAFLLADYRAALGTLGRPVRAQLAESVVEGRAVDVTSDGALVIETAGRRVVVEAGEVVHLRPG